MPYPLQTYTYHGYLLAAYGRAEEGVSHVKRALFLDPLNPRTPFLNILGYVYYLAGEPGKALASMSRSLERGGPVSPGDITHQVVILASLDRHDEARALARKLQDLNTWFDLTTWVSWINRTVWRQQDRDKFFHPLEEIGLL